MSFQKKKELQSKPCRTGPVPRVAVPCLPANCRLVVGRGSQDGGWPDDSAPRWDAAAALEHLPPGLLNGGVEVVTNTRICTFSCFGELADAVGSISGGDEQKFKAKR